MSQVGQGAYEQVSVVVAGIGGTIVFDWELVVKSAGVRAEGMVTFTPSALSFTDDLRYPTWQSFLDSEVEATGFFLDACPPELQDALLWQIRGSRWWNAWVALSLRAPKSEFESLADGKQAQEDAQKAASHVNVARSHQPDEPYLDFRERLLRFLLVRDGAVLQPYCDRNSFYLYRFPLAEALGGDADRVTLKLMELQRQRILAPLNPVDRVRHCRKCNSAHPHYHDVCPKCRSIQIEKAPSLHCFTCGNVAPQADFMRDGKLVCPQCQTRLRHIGVDYDRPMAQYSCLDCHHVFLEADVQVRCLDCDEVSDPDSLEVRTVAPLRLSAHGRAALREAWADDVLTEHPRHVPFGTFQRMVMWSMVNADVSSDATSCLVLLDFGSASDGGFMGERANGQIDEGIRRTQEVLSSTDLSALDAQQRLWVLAADGTKVIRRLRRIFPAEGESRMRAAMVELSKLKEVRDLQKVMAQMEAGLR